MISYPHLLQKARIPGPVFLPPPPPPQYLIDLLFYALKVLPLPSATVRLIGNAKKCSQFFYWVKMIVFEFNYQYTYSQTEKKFALTL
jgi:hypothetical protein